MKKAAFHTLRIGMAITFIWIGVLIWMSPGAWGMALQPWAAKLMDGMLISAMKQTAVLDIVVGLALLFNVFTWFTAIVGAVHIAIVLVTVGVTSVTVRDIGLLGGTIALAIHAWPDWLAAKIASWKRKMH